MFSYFYIPVGNIFFSNLRFSLLVYLISTNGYRRSNGWDTAIYQFYVSEKTDDVVYKNKIETTIKLVGTYFADFITEFLVFKNLISVPHQNKSYI